MKKIIKELYKCDICGTPHNTEERALRCENSHSTLGFMCEQLFYPGSQIPYEIKVDHESYVAVYAHVKTMTHEEYEEYLNKKCKAED